MKTINLKHIFLIIAYAILFNSCKTTSTALEPKITTNSKASIERPYLILVSLDGFRWDYVKKYNPPHLSKFIKNGVEAESLISSFPSKTFPNHYTIATGLYPENHGLIGNSYYSYDKNVTYKIRNREMVQDGTFYKGTPIWVHADKSQMVTASYFFVGTEADIQGVRPTYYYNYDGKTKNETRVSQALNWLKLPEKTRPHFIAMYFSDLDDIGHKYSPDNEEEIEQAVLRLDKHLGNLFEGAKATGLPVNIIVVSDHGMTSVKTENFIPLETIENNTLYTAIDNGAIINIHPKANIDTDSILSYLKPLENNFKVYKTENTPGFEYTPKNKDWGTIQILPDYGYYFNSSKAIERRKSSLRKQFGVHGYDTNQKDMHGIFYANGPAFKNGYVAPSVKNIHIYPIMCKILGLEIPNDIDGNLEKLKPILK